MPSVTPKPLRQGVLLDLTAPVSPGLYIAVTSLGSTILSLTLCNQDTVPRSVTVYIVASGDTAAPKSTIFKDFELKPKETVVDDTRRNMALGDFITAFADAASVVSLRVDGAEIA